MREFIRRAFCELLWIVLKGEAFKILNDLEQDELRAIRWHDNVSSASKVSFNLQVEIITTFLNKIQGVYKIKGFACERDLCVKLLSNHSHKKLSHKQNVLFYSSSLRPVSYGTPRKLWPKWDGRDRSCDWTSTWMSSVWTATDYEVVSRMG